MRQLEGKVALVTGGAKGIGEAMVRLFTAEGAQVAFTFINSSERAAELEKELHAKGYKANAASYQDAHSVIDSVINDFGKIDILVNNAGITRDSLLMRMDEEQWSQVIATNLTSAFNYTQAVSAHMLRNRAGSILNVSSISGLHGNAGQTNYAASKAGLIGFTKSAAKEFASRGVRVNAIAPGFILTDMTSKFNAKHLEEWCRMIPLQRGGTAEEVARAALFLVSDQASYITGETLQIDGGMGI